MPPGALPSLEEPDYHLLVEAGRAHGLRFEVRYWDDPALPREGYDGAIVRSCWDYIERADEFIETLAAHESAGLRLFNRADVVRWNFRKTYLNDLGALAIPTFWSEKIDARSVAQAFDALDAAEIVIKPQIGGGSRNTLRLQRNAWSEADLREAPADAAMIQPFLRSIQTEGERSLFWFGGVFSHAIRKVPNPGGWFANIPKETQFFSDAPPADAMEIAEAARAIAPQDLLYVRIDLVRGEDGAWRVIEIEAIEPYLFLAFAPEGAGALASAITRVLSL
jgi:hypothetical protein